MKESRLRSSRSSTSLRQRADNSNANLSLSCHGSNPFLDKMTTGTRDCVSCCDETAVTSQNRVGMKGVTSRSRIVDITTIKAVIETVDNESEKPSDCDNSIAGSGRKSFLSLGLPRNTSQGSVGSKTSDLSATSSHSKNFYIGGISRIRSSGSNIANSIISAPAKLMQSIEANYSMNTEDNSDGSAPKISSNSESNAKREKYHFAMQAASILEGNEVSSDSLMSSISNLRAPSNSSMKNIAVILNASNKMNEKPIRSNENNMCSTLQFMKYLESNTSRVDMYDIDNESETEPQSPQSIGKNGIDCDDVNISFVDAVSQDRNEPKSSSSKPFDDIKKGSRRRRGVSKSSSVSSIEIQDEVSKENRQSRSRSSTNHRRNLPKCQKSFRSRSSNSSSATDLEEIVGKTHQPSNKNHNYDDTKTSEKMHLTSNQVNDSPKSMEIRTVGNMIEDTKSKTSKKRQQKDNAIISSASKVANTDETEFYFEDLIVGERHTTDEGDDVSTINSSYHDLHSSFKDLRSSTHAYNSSYRDLHSSYKDFDSSYDDFVADEDEDEFCVIAVSSEEDGDIIRYEDYWQDIDTDASSKNDKNTSCGSKKSRQLKPKLHTKLHPPIEQEKGKSYATTKEKSSQQQRPPKRRGQRKLGLSSEKKQIVTPRQQDLSQSLRSLFSTHSASSSMISSEVDETVATSPSSASMNQKSEPFVKSSGDNFNEND